IAELQWGMIVLFCVVTIIMWVIIGWAAITRRGTLAEHAPIDDNGGHGWITVGGLIIPFIILFVLFVLGLRLLASFPIHEASERHNLRANIVVVGHQWWWEIRYLGEQPDQIFTTANEIHIPTNTPITLKLVTRDVIHSFWIPALHGKVDLIPGHTNWVRIEASHPGTYLGQCAEYCGAQHAHMRLMLVAQTPEQYQKWLQGQLAPGKIPATPEAVAGEQVFLNGPCSLCHTVRGTIAGGTVGPDLTHFGSRKMLGSDSFPNNNPHHPAWITYARSYEPRGRLPARQGVACVAPPGLAASIRPLN